MSSTPTGRSADIQRLVTAGYSVEIRQNHLLMYDVPYVDESRQVRRGTLVTPLTLAGNVTTAPSDHIAYFIGTAPCTWQGIPMTALNHSGPNELAPGLRIDRSFSNASTRSSWYRVFLISKTAMTSFTGQTDASV